MALLGAVHYDPSTAVSKATSTLIAMTALDTTNLRITFTAPSNGKVLVRLRGVCSHGATTYAQVLLGILESSTVKGRMAPIGSPQQTALATSPLVGEATFLVTGLTAGNQYTWDAAYGVELAVASSNLKYGGPNNATTNDAWGAFVFEVWETDNLLAGTLYDPGTAVSKSTATLIAMTAFDTTNLRLTFTAPSSGRVLVRIAGMLEGATTMPVIMLGVLDGSTVKGRGSPIGGQMGTALATSRIGFESKIYVGGLTPSQSYTWDAAYGVEIVLASTNIKYGGPNNTTQDDAFGGLAYEIWSA